MAKLGSFDERQFKMWERGEMPNGIPYYMNHETEKTQWDHPMFIAMIEDLAEANNIKYAAYRMASKLRRLQISLKLNLVTLPVIAGVFSQHNEDELVSAADVEARLHELFNSVQPHAGLNTGLQAELCLNLILNLYDRQRSGSLETVLVKIAMVLFCTARLQDKAQYLFGQFADNNNCISKRQMNKLLRSIAQIPEFLYEKPSFGSHLVTAAVDSCMQNTSSYGVPETLFVGWMLQEPQNLVWLSTWYRLAFSETVQHDAKCAVCKMTPITGLRYRCMKCFGYDQCQHCFFTGQLSRGHKLKHPMHEYCTQSSSKDDTKALIQTVCNQFRKKQMGKQRYLPIHASPLAYGVMPWENPGGAASSSSSSSASSGGGGGGARNMTAAAVAQPVADGKHRQLESILVNLEEENRHLISEIERLHSEKPPSEADKPPSDVSLRRQELLDDHNHQLEVQIKRLRQVVQEGNPAPTTATNGGTPQHANPTTAMRRYDSSTPAAAPHQQQTPQHLNGGGGGVNLDLLSPIKPTQQNGVHHPMPQNGAHYQNGHLPQNGIYEGVGEATSTPLAAVTLNQSSGDPSTAGRILWTPGELDGGAPLERGHVRRASTGQTEQEQSWGRYGGCTRRLLVEGRPVTPEVSSFGRQRSLESPPGIDTLLAPSNASHRGFTEMQDELEAILQQLETVFPKENGRRGYAT